MNDSWQDLQDRQRGAWYQERDRLRNIESQRQQNQYSSGSSNNWLNNSSSYNTSSSYSNDNYSSYNWGSSGSSAPSKPWRSLNWFEKLIRVFIEIPLSIIQILFILWILGGMFYPPLHEALTPVMYTLWQILCELLQVLGEILNEFT